MDKFQDAYREAAKELPEFHMDVESVQDEMHHRRMQMQRRKYLVARGCTAAAVLLLCGAGTVAAKSYRDSVVKLSENGFIITSAGDGREELTEDQNLPDPASVLNLGGAFSIEEGIPDEEQLEAYEPEIEEYNSIEEFRALSNVTAAIPDIGQSGQIFTNESVDVLDEGRELHIYVYNETASFLMMQSDNRDWESYSSATSYMGQSGNERSFTNSQGLNYVMFDTLNEKGETDSIHAVISVNGRDLSYTFWGFEEDVIEEILYTLDLTVYFQEER